jgi:hypothetical protein
MYEQDISGVAIVDSEQGGKLVGSLDSSLLRGLKELSFADLGLPVLDFAKMQREKYAEYLKSDPVQKQASEDEALNVDDVVAPFTAIEASSRLSEVLELMRSHHIHRLYVVDDKYRPIGTATTSDVLNLFVPKGDEESGAAAK